MWTDLRHRLRALFSRHTVEEDIGEELRFHFERQVEAYEAAGMDRREAMRRARIDVGGLDQITEEYRDALGVRLVDDTRRDLRLAFRALASAPLVTAVVVLSLALAIGANTAFFSILNSLAFRSLPVRDPGRMVHVTDSVLREGGETRVRAWSHPVWLQIRQQNLFEASTAWSFARFNLADGGETQFVDGLWADGHFFEALGVPVVLGRAITRADDQRGGGPDGPVAVISYGYWQRQFGGTRDVIGRTVRLDGVPFVIVGVTPREFFGPEVGRRFDFIVPVTAEALVRGSDSDLDSASSNFLTVMARLNAGQSPDAAAVEFRRVQPAIREATLGPWSRDAVDRYLTSPFTVLPAATGYSNLRSTYERPLLAIAGVAALVLLIGCLNVANLLLARVIARRHELGVRLALGATRRRLVRQFLTESLLLATAGAGLGMAIAKFGSALLVEQLSRPGNFVFLDLSIDGRILAFTVALTVLTTIVFGIAPVLQITRAQPADPLKEESRGFSETTRGGLMTGLLMAQIAVSMVLVVAAGLFLRSFLDVSHRDLGFEPSQLVVVYMSAEGASIEPAQRVPLYERVRQAVASLPDVSGAAVSHLTPVGGGGFTPAVEISGDSDRAQSSQLVRADQDVFGNLISNRWFDTFGIRLIAGRDFTEHDRGGSPPVVIVNERFARRFFPGANPFERTITVYPNTPRAITAQVVGVVADAIYTSPLEPVPPTWYMPMMQFTAREFGAVRLAVRARTGSPMSLTRNITTAVASVNPQLTLTFRAVEEQIDASLTRERLMAQLASGFGVLALLLAGLGLYGVTAYMISSRQTEMAIRIALGAHPRRVLAMVAGRLSLVVAGGVVSGLCVSLWASRLVAGLLHGLPPRDLQTLIGSVIVLCAVALVAAAGPARRIGRIDPIGLLRKS